MSRGASEVGDQNFTMAASLEDDKKNLSLIALLGRPDAPTDGVADYCAFLATAFELQGIHMELTHVRWMEDGWVRGLRYLWRQSAGLRGHWVLLQYTGLAWSSRGFPFGAVVTLAILRRRGVRCAVVFHESSRQSKGSTRWIDRIRGACQDWVIQKLYRTATKSIFTVPVETVAWLPKGEDKAASIPIGASIPECARRRAMPALTTKAKTVIVYGLTDSLERAAPEVNDISSVMLEACKSLGRLRLVVVGRGAFTARELLEKAFQEADVDLMVRGVLPAEEIARELESADALLFVRGGVTPQRSSAMAGIASGIPIVGYRHGSISGPLEEAGVEWSPWQDRDSLARGLIRVLSDPQHWMELHERNLNVQKKYLSWSRIAERFQEVLGG